MAYAMRCTTSPSANHRPAERMDGELTGLRVWVVRSDPESEAFKYRRRTGTYAMRANQPWNGALASEKGKASPSRTPLPTAGKPVEPKVSRGGGGAVISESVSRDDESCKEALLHDGRQNCSTNRNPQGSSVLHEKGQEHGSVRQTRRARILSKHFKTFDLANISGTGITIP